MRLIDADALIEFCAERWIPLNIDAVNMQPSVQPEPAIPLSWVEKYIEWLKGLDNEFTKLAAAHISVMVKKWRDEQNERPN